MQQFFEQLINLFGSQATGRRAMFLGVMAVTIAGLCMLVFQAKTGNYQQVFGELPPGEAAMATAKLRRMDIDARLGKSGTSIEVPSVQFDLAMMALAEEGLPASGVVGYELMDKSGIGLSEFEQKVRHQRSLEGEIARTIMTIRGIERARVHLALPKPSLFVREQTRATASVFVKVRSGQRLTAKNVRGISALVSYAVEGLETEGVSIIDSDGVLISEGAGDEGASRLGDRLAFKIEYENRIKDRIETMLSRTVGLGKVVAQVSTDFDFAETSTSTETYDPDGQVVRRENHFGEGRAAADSAAEGGAAGSSSNLPPGFIGTTMATGTGGTRTKFDRETVYEISRTMSQKVETVPVLQRQTVSVLVDGKYDEVEDADGNTIREFAKLDEATLQTLEESVKNIMGFSEERSSGLADVVSVRCVQFQTLGDDILGEAFAAPMFTPSLMRDIVQWAMVGLISVLLIFTVLRPAVRSVALIPPPVAAVAGALGSGHAGGAAAAIGGAGGAEAVLPPGQGNPLLAAGSGATEEPFEDPQTAQIQKQARTQARASVQQYEALREEVNNAAIESSGKAAGIIRSWIDE